MRVAFATYVAEGLVDLSSLREAVRALDYCSHQSARLRSQGAALTVMMHFMAKDRFLQLLRERVLKGETFQLSLPFMGLQVEVFADYGDDLRPQVYNLSLIEKSQHFFLINGVYIRPFGDEFTWA